MNELEIYQKFIKWENDISKSVIVHKKDTIVEKIPETILLLINKADEFKKDLEIKALNVIFGQLIIMRQEGKHLI